MRSGLQPVAVVVSCAALAVGLTVAVSGGASGAPTGPRSTPTIVVVPRTHAPRLSQSDVARFAAALGVHGLPQQDSGYWEVTDPERSVVFERAPGSWYVLFTDSSVLLEPPAPGTRLPKATAEPAPTASDALAAARSVLTRAGVLPGEWRSRTGAAADMPAVCRPLPTPYDCNEIRLRTRHVVFTRALAGRPTTVEWEVLVGPGSRILDAVGRIAVLGTRSARSR